MHLSLNLLAENLLNANSGFVIPRLHYFKDSWFARQYSPLFSINTPVSNNVNLKKHNINCWANLNAIIAMLCAPLAVYRQSLPLVDLTTFQTPERPLARSQYFPCDFLGSLGFNLNSRQLVLTLFPCFLHLESLFLYYFFRLFRWFGWRWCSAQQKQQWLFIHNHNFG